MINHKYNKAQNVLWWLLLIATVMLLYADFAYAEDLSFPASANESDNVTVVLTPIDEEMYAATVKGNGSMKDYQIPGQRPWKSYVDKIQTITVESGITHVGDMAFAEFDNLTTVKLNKGLKTIGDNAFRENDISVSVPQSVEYIGKAAFWPGEITVNGSRTQLAIVEADEPEPVALTVKAYFGSYVVQNWQSVFIDEYGRESELPVELVTMDPFEYEDPDNPTEIVEYKSDAAALTMPDGILTIGEGAFCGNDYLEIINVNKVTTIRAEAFAGCVLLKKAFIPSTVETIEEGAFAGCDDLTIYGNHNSEAYRYAEENGIDFIAMKPYLVDQESNTVSAEIPAGDKFELDLSKYFAADYDTELSYESKSGESDYQAIEENKYVFNAETAGVFTITFRAVDSYNTPSDDTLSAIITVINNEAPVLDGQNDECKEIALFGEPVTINLNGAFTDPDGDQISYKMIMAGDHVDWDEAFDIEVEDGVITYTPWQLSEIGKESQFLIKAYDKWGKASEKAFKVYIKTHSANVQVKAGAGIHSLDSLKFKFSREGAEDIVKPIEVVGNNYYFDLEYVTRIADTTGEELYVGPYEYSYEVTLDGCEPIEGTRKFGRGVQLSGNTIEAEFSNPAQAEADAKAVADLIEAIDNLGDITLDSENAVNTAQAAYEALYEDLKPQVTNYAKLLEAKIDLAELKLKAAENELEQVKRDKDATEKELETAKGDLQTAVNEKQKAEQELQNLKDEIAAKALKVSGLKLKSKGRKITVNWTKNADADGYRVQFKLKSAKKYKTLKTLTGIKAVSKKLKKGKKYQFRVATYKTVDGKKIYGKWVTKTVKCK